MATKSISQLDTAVSLDNGDLFETAIPDAGSASGYASKKMTLAQLADYAANEVVYPDFDTSAKSITGAVNQTLANFADEYDSTATYAVGDVVLYTGNLYKCETAVSTPEAFDPLKWTQGTAADFFAGGGDGGSTQVIAEQHQVWGSIAPSSFTSNSFTAEAGDLFLVAILNRGTVTMPERYTQLASQLFSAANDSMYTFAYFATAAGAEQFTVSFSDSQRTEVCVLQIRGATNADLQTNTIQTSVVGSTSAITPPSGNSVTFIARRYTNFTGTSGMQLNTRQLAVYEATPISSGQWIIAIANFGTLLQSTFIVTFDSNTPYAIAGVALEDITA